MVPQKSINLILDKGSTECPGNVVLNSTITDGATILLHRCVSKQVVVLAKVAIPLQSDCVIDAEIGNMSPATSASICEHVNVPT
jgi:hypothetical protein